MPKANVTERAVRILLRSIIEDAASELDDLDPINVSDVVDPSAADTQPDNVNFSPQNSRELRGAMSRLANDVPDDDAPKVYAAVKDVVAKTIDVDTADAKKYAEEDKSERRTESTMKHTSLREKHIENVIRERVRKIIAEAGSGSFTFSGWPQSDHDEEEDDDDEEERRPRKHIQTVVDVSGDFLNKIAQEFGRSMAGAKRIVHVTTSHASFLSLLIEKKDNSFERMIAHAFGVFKDMLRDELELQAKEGPGETTDYVDDPDPGMFTQADMDKLDEEPETYMQMNSFRVLAGEYLHRLMKRAADDYVTDPDYQDDLRREVEEWVSINKPNYKDEAREAMIEKTIDKCKKNASYEVVEFPTFKEFVVDVWSFTDEDMGQPPSDLRSMITKYLNADVGRAGKEDEE